MESLCEVEEVRIKVLSQEMSSVDEIFSEDLAPLAGGRKRICRFSCNFVVELRPVFCIDPR